MTKKNDTEFSTRSIKNQFNNHTNLRVSLDAIHLTAEELEEYAEKIAVKAKEVAERDGRVTVRRQDVRGALRELELNGE